MQFNIFTMIKPHDIQTAPKEEHNDLLDENDEPNNEHHPFEEVIPYLGFLLTMSHRVSSDLMFFALQKRQGTCPTLVT